MGKGTDYSPQEIKFLAQCFEKSWTDKAIEQEIQDTTEYSPRPARTVGKIRKIYEAVKQVYLQEFYEDTRKKLEARLDKMAEEAIKGKTALDIRRIIEVINFMSEHKGARPRYDEKTGEIWYEPPPDF